MSFLVFALDLYFAAMFGSSGLSKISNPRSFSNILRQQAILPGWSTGIVSLALPLTEILIALLLISGIAAFVSAALVLAFLLIFLGVKVFLLTTRSSADCGCHGGDNPRPVDSASVIASTILVLLAILHLGLAIRIAPVSWPWRLIAGCLFAIVACFLVGKIIVRYRMDSQVTKQTVLPAVPISSSNEQLPQS